MTTDTAANQLARVVRQGRLLATELQARGEFARAHEIELAATEAEELPLRLGFAVLSS